MRYLRRIMTVLSAVASVWLVRRQQRRMRARAWMSPTQARQLLTRAAPVIRLPTAPDRLPEVEWDGSGLRCPVTGRLYPYRNGVLDLLAHDPQLTITQHTLDTALTAWLYDRGRNGLLWLFGLPSFAREVAMTDAQLHLQPGDTVLDLACGHGNFTVAWARRVGGDGLVIGLDISRSMLRRAVTRLQHAQLSNVLLIRGDAQALPFANGSLRKINCSGGFHQLPDLPQALRELARVSMPGAVLTASTFAQGPHDRNAPVKRWLQRHAALHFVPLDALQPSLAALGFHDYRASLLGDWFGYLSARRTR